LLRQDFLIAVASLGCPWLHRCKGVPIFSVLKVWF
jgi:hypothetical protein